MNNKGFILPLTAMFTTLLLFWISHNTMVYFSQQAFYNELKKSYYLDNLHTLAVLEVKEQLVNQEVELDKLMIEYPSGVMEATFTQQSHSVLHVDIICYLSDKYVRRFFYTFNKESEKLYPRE